MSYRIRVLFTLAAIAAAGFAAPATAATSDATSVMAVVHRFVDGFNRGNTTSALACVPSATIIDDFPPHQWQSCADWASAYDAWAKANGVTDGIVTLGKPSHVDVTGNVAYVVNPATYTYKQHGKAVTMAGAIWTVVLKKAAARWRIASWAWADH